MKSPGIGEWRRSFWPYKNHLGLRQASALVVPPIGPYELRGGKKPPRP